MEANTHTDFKIQDDEGCRSKQLLNDSLRIYEEILASIPPQYTNMQARIENRIRMLKQKITDHKNRKPDGDSDDEIDSII